jgi:hypothetical protein
MIDKELMSDLIETAAMNNIIDYNAVPYLMDCLNMCEIQLDLNDGMYELSTYTNPLTGKTKIVGIKCLNEKMIEKCKKCEKLKNIFED